MDWGLAPRVRSVFTGVLNALEGLLTAEPGNGAIQWGVGPLAPRRIPTPGGRGSCRASPRNGSGEDRD